jgi:hypothetical protein
MKARQGRQVKNTVMTAKCKLTREECRDPKCPVHGEPTEDGQSEEERGSTLKGADKVAAAEAEGRKIAASGLEIPITGDNAYDVVSSLGGPASLPEIGATNELPLHVVGVLRDAHDLIQHIQHHNEFTKGLLKRMEDILDPPKELMTMEEARVRLGLAG